MDPASEGFTYPPEKITEPGLIYVSRTMELRDLAAFYFNFVKTSSELALLIPEDQRTKAPKESIGVLQYNYSKQRPLFSQVMLSRAVESFDLYVTSILKEIFLARPEILKSEGSIDIATVIDAGNYDELMLHIVERKVHELSYKPLSALRAFISSRAGIDLFQSQDLFEAIIVASEVRNLIAHNNCVVNDLFRSRTRGLNLPFELQELGRLNIEDSWLRRVSYMLDNLVFRFDILAAEKFDLRTRSRG